MPMVLMGMKFLRRWQKNWVASKFRIRVLYRILIFLIINFLGLAIGAKYTDPGVNSEWYQSLNKAPWTPPGWLFGVAWTVIMICFSIYLAFLWDSISNKWLFIILFIAALALNVLWNPVFFENQQVLFGFIIISALTVLIAFYLFFFWSNVKFISLLLLPYLLWLIIATSLNGYILLNN